MPAPIGTFVWYDLMTGDVEAAVAFYCKVIGWTAQGFAPDNPYKVLSAGPIGIGGIMPFPEQAANAEARPSWRGYIAVDNVDVHAERVKETGGTICHGPEDIPTVGRFAVAADPHGAIFILFKPLSDQTPTPVAPGTPGHIGWRELHAGDQESDFAFYANLFGWTIRASLSQHAS